MYSLHLKCQAEEAEQVSFALWEAGTVGIREEVQVDGLKLIAGFEDAADRNAIALEFGAHEPAWEREQDTDWFAVTQLAWPGRMVGQRVYLAPVWNTDATPQGRVRVIHNPGLASGTGEHPCTQLALEALERHIAADSMVVDIGTGSGILSIAAMQLGARFAVAIDNDEASLRTAHENFLLNALEPWLAAGSVDCIASQTAGIVVANISGTVLLALADDLMRICRPGGQMILTGFPDSELSILKEVFGGGEVTEMNEWRCLTVHAR